MSLSRWRKALRVGEDWTERYPTMVYQERFSFETTGHRHMVDVTGQVAAIAERSGIQTGIVQVFCVGSTAAVGAIEFEPGLQRDLPELPLTP